MRVLEKDMVNASVLLEVIYTPKIICDGILSSIARVKVNQTGFMINCRVSSNPPIPDPNVMVDTRTWLDGDCSSNKQIIESAEYHLTDDAVPGNQKNRVIGLQFKQKITKNHFGKKFCLRVRNERGHGEQTITLQELKLGAVSLMTSASLTYLIGLFLTAATLYNYN